MIILISLGAILITYGLVWLLRNIDSNTALGVIILGVAFIFAGTVFAHDHERPSLNSWYQSLRSDMGPCCDGPNKDAMYLNDTDWETKDGHYRVRIDGKWVDVPDAAILKEPNKDGRTLVWPMWMNGEMTVRCFIPGSMI